MFKTLASISRILVGSLFIVSGLIKANDPIGFSYKLEEYFSVDVLNLPFFEPWALSIAVFVCVVEIALGVAAIFGSKIKLVSWSLLLMILFFTFLTFYSAYFDKVTDCGCFGDALKLTPWGSFTKDIVLLVLVLFIFFERNKILENTLWQDLIFVPVSIVAVGLFSILVIGWSFPLVFTIVLLLLVFGIKNFTKIPQKDIVLAAVALGISLVFSLYCIAYLPVKDFRPYAVGKSITDQMSIPEGAQADVYENYLTYKNTQTGETKRFTFQEFVELKISEDAAWEWQDTESVLITKGYEPPIHDFNLVADDGNDYTMDVLEEEFMLLLIYHDMKKSSKKVQPKVVDLATYFGSKGFYTYGLTASNYETLEAFRHEHQLPVDFLTADQTMLKTVVRSNPGIVLLKKGTVIGKWHHNRIPSKDEIDFLLSASE